MKTVILAGGRGSRLSEETYVKPKPMVEIGGIPILVHIMRLYADAELREFVLALGYRGESIKDYFVNYHLRNSDVAVNLRTGETSYLNPMVPDWTVRMIDTGLDTLTGGRLKRLEHLLAPEGTFMLTYGDGVADIESRPAAGVSSRPPPAGVGHCGPAARPVRDDAPGRR